MGRLYVGVDLGGTNIVSGVLDEDGNVVSRDKRPTMLQLGRDRSILRLIDSIRESISKAGVKVEELSGIGIGSPGTLDPFAGVIIAPENLPDWRNVPIVEIIQKEFDVPTVLDNDANVVAVGEQWKGAGKGFDSFLCVTLGTGVGGGAICNGKLLTGFNGNAAEIGHLTVDYKGPRCNCGNYGCMELYASATAIVRRAKEKIRSENPDTVLSEFDGFTAEDIHKAAKGGDRFAVEMFEETGFFLGVGLVSAINVLNVEVIAITGGMAKAGDLIFEPVRETILERGLPGVKDKVKVIPVELGEDAALMGAAKISIDRLSAK